MFETGVPLILGHGVVTKPILVASIIVVVVVVVVVTLARFKFPLLFRLFDEYTSGEWWRVGL